MRLKHILHLLRAIVIVEKSVFFTTITLGFTLMLTSIFFYFRLSVLLRLFILLPVLLFIGYLLFIYKMRKNDLPIGAIEKLKKKIPGLENIRIHTFIDIIDNNFIESSSRQMVTSIRNKYDIKISFSDFFKIYSIEIISLKNIVSAIIIIVIVIIRTYFYIYPWDFLQNNTFKSTGNLVEFNERREFLFGSLVDVSFRFQKKHYTPVSMIIESPNSKNEYPISSILDERFTVKKEKNIIKTVHFRDKFFSKSLNISFIFRKGLYYYRTRQYSMKMIDERIFKSIKIKITPPGESASRQIWNRQKINSIFYGSRVDFLISSDYGILINEKKLSFKNGYYRYHIIVTGKEPVSVRFRAKRNDSMVESSIYEFYYKKDEPPRLEIPQYKKRIIVAKPGKLRLKLLAEDDYQIKDIRYYYVSEGSIIKEGKIPIASKTKKIERIVEVPLVYQKSSAGYQIIFEAVDNSARKTNNPYKNKVQSGQRCFSSGPFIIPWNKQDIEKNSNSSKKELNIIEEFEKELLKDTKELKKQYANLESQKSALLKRKQKNDEIELSELQKWNEKSQSIEKMGKNLAERMQTLDDLQRRQNLYNGSIKKNIAEFENKDWDELRRKFNKLMSEMPRDYDQSEKRIRELSERESIKALENAIKMMQLEKRLQMIDETLQKLDSEENRINEISQNTLRKKEEYKKYAQRHREEIEKIKKGIHEAAKEYQFSDKRILPHPNDERKWNQMDNETCAGYDCRIMQNHRRLEYIHQWKNTLNEEKIQSFEKKLERDMNLFLLTSYQINNISKSLSGIEMSQKNINLSRQLSLLEEYYIYYVQKQITKSRAYYYFTEKEIKALEKPITEFYFLRRNLHDQKFYLVDYSIIRIKKQMNYASFILLSMKDKMSSQNSSLKKGRAKAMMKEGSATQKKMKDLSNKPGISNAEKALLDYYKKRIAQLKRQTRTAISESLQKDEIESKKMSSLLKTLKNPDANLKNIEKQLPLSEESDIKRKESVQNRESQTGRIYDNLPVHHKEKTKEDNFPKYEDAFIMDQKFYNLYKNKLKKKSLKE